MGNSVATTNNAPAKITIKEYISAPAVVKKMQEMLVDKDTIRNFTTSLISLAGQDALLADAEPRSLFNAALTAASLNFPINKNLGFAHIIGYKDNRRNIVEAQFQLGARGFKELAQRSGRYKIINEGDVREGELKGRNRLTGELEFNWINDDTERNKAKVVGYFSYFELDNGFKNTLYMSVEELTDHAKQYSQVFKKFGSGPWKDNFEAMARKTVMKRNISKNGPLDVNLQKAVNLDQAVIHDDGKAEFVDGTDTVIEGELANDDEAAAILDANTDKSNGEIKEPTTKKK